MTAAAFYQRHYRTITFPDLNLRQSKTVSISFNPVRVTWEITGEMNGAGTLTISEVYSNRVSGRFSINGSGDYYSTNATVSFIPEGEPTGKIHTSLRFHKW